jgi:hypothetical protein
VGVFVWVTDAPAYLQYEPHTHNNCHVMDAQYENQYLAAHARAVNSRTRFLKETGS